MALLFNRWDVDDFLNDIPFHLFDEWMRFLTFMSYGDSRPLDPTYMIMRGLMGSTKKGRQASAAGGWEQVKMNLVRHMNITKSGK